MDYHITYVFMLSTNVFLIETMCSDLDLGTYLKGQSHTRHLKVRVHMLVSALLPTYELKLWWVRDIGVLWTSCLVLAESETECNE